MGDCVTTSWQLLAALAPIFFALGWLTGSKLTLWRQLREGVTKEQVEEFHHDITKLRTLPDLDSFEPDAIHEMRKAGPG